MVGNLEAFEENFLTKLDSHTAILGLDEVDFMGKFSASGVYFYRIDITGNNSNERFSQTKSMILLK